MKWYYAQNGQRQGPVSDNEFDFLVHQKKILPDTLVWNETMKEWRPLREVLPEPAPPPPPAFYPGPPAAPERDGPAWEERDKIGGIHAAVRTVIELMGNSDRAFSRMNRFSDWAGPYCFALFVEGIGQYVSLIYAVIICRMNPGNLSGFAELFTLNSAVVVLGILFWFSLPFFVAFMVTLNSALIHFCLMLVGVRQPFQATYRVVCYSFGASAAWQLIPKYGFLLMLVWYVTMLIIGLARVHEISIGRAVVAMIPVTLCTGFLILICLGAA